MSINDFQPMPVRLRGELEERQENGKRALKYHLAFLDDYLRGVLPNDLVLLGAPTGVGKTDLALGIATSNAMHKRRVAYFALEAEPRELERRTKYALLSAEAHRAKHPRANELNYADWLLGRCEDIVGPFNARTDQSFLEHLCSLQTYYRGLHFTATTLKEEVEAVHKFVDLIIVDHLHYIDTEHDENETRAQGDTVKAIRDIALTIGKPVILVAHLRKRNTTAKQIVAGIEEFHGSSNITKICTQAIVIERAHGIDSPKWFLSPTFMSIPKDRRLGACRLVALCYYDIRTRGYLPTYTLGKLTKGGTEWEPLTDLDRPGWAKNAKGLPS